MNEGINVRVESSRNVFLLVKTHIYLFIKRIFDIIVSFIGLLFIMPIGIIIKISYILHKDYSSIFYAQKRIGKDGKEFNFVKFRSMIPNADEALEKLLDEDEELALEYKRNKKLENDPRITKMGRIIRKFSIDELPQFVNVFVGEMSIIGNRPYLPREKEDMGEDFDIIVKTRPGLTGYWQVGLRNRGTFAQRLQMERYYSEHCGLKMDIKIFFKTFGVVFGCKGAK